MNTLRTFSQSQSISTTTDERYQHISKVINKALKSGISPIDQSLFISGGTISPYELKLYIGSCVNIGFCQPKFFKRHVWLRSKKIMQVAVNIGVAIPKDFGLGKGKYTTNFTIEQIIDKVYNKLS